MGGHVLPENMSYGMTCHMGRYVLQENILTKECVLQEDMSCGGHVLQKNVFLR